MEVPYDNTRMHFLAVCSRNSRGLRILGNLAHGADNK